MILKQNIKVYATPRETAKAFADILVDYCSNRPSEEVITIALSGGSTPKLLFELLAREYAGKLPWERIHLFWGDERCVPPDHTESNYLMTKQALLDKVAIPEQNIHRILGENRPKEEAIRYSNEIKQHVQEFNGLPSFDINLLGLGTDGHTASIFPNQMGLLTSGNICEVAEYPETGQKRITLTGKVLNNAKNTFFLVTGESKKEKVSDILEEAPHAKEYPANYIAGDRVNYILDEAAAQLLKV